MNTLLMALLTSFQLATATDVTNQPTVFTYTDAGNRGGNIVLSYGKDTIMAMVSGGNKPSFIINLCSKSCRHSDKVNVKNVAFVTAARNIGCVVETSGKWDCPKMVPNKPASGTVYEDGSTEP